MKKLIQRFLGKTPNPKKEPVHAKWLAPPLNYYTMDIVHTDGDYDDNSFYNDLDKITKEGYGIPKDYEEVK